MELTYDQRARVMESFDLLISDWAGKVVARTLQYEYAKSNILNELNRQLGSIPCDMALELAAQLDAAIVYKRQVVEHPQGAWGVFVDKAYEAHRKQHAPEQDSVSLA